MLKFSGVLLKMSTFIFILSSVAITKGNIIRVSAMEGEEIQLNFSYPCNSLKVTLQRGRGAPFYDSAIPESKALPGNEKHRVRNEIIRDNCFIRMLFTPVSRYDRGIFKLFAYAGDGKLLQDIRVGLRVDYSPGKASCKWGTENVADDWRSLQCTAQPGSLVGEIICFQNGIWVPPEHLPRDGVSSLKEIIWMRYSQPTFCCAIVVVVGQTIDQCKCKDYTWDPFSNLTDPCQEASTSSQSKKVTQKTKKNHRSNIIYWGIIGILVEIIIGIFIALRVSNRKANQFKENGKTAYSQLNHVYVHTDDKGGKIIEM